MSACDAASEGARMTDSGTTPPPGMRTPCKGCGRIAADRAMCEMGLELDVGGGERACRRGGWIAPARVVFV